jgi:hypothetical protein
MHPVIGQEGDAPKGSLEGLPIELINFSVLFRQHRMGVWKLLGTLACGAAEKAGTRPG